MRGAVRPIDVPESQAATAELFAEFFGPLLHGFAHEPVSGPAKRLTSDLLPDTFVISQQTLVAQFLKIVHGRQLNKEVGGGPPTGGNPFGGPCLPIEI